MSIDLNESILQAALEGLERRRDQLEEQIRSVRSLLGTGRPAGRERGGPVRAESDSAIEPPEPRKRRRGMSAAGKRAIAEAQKRRWAAVRREGAAPGEKAVTRRRFSAAVRKRLAEAMRKRWAAKRTATQAQATRRTKTTAATKKAARKGGAKRAGPKSTIAVQSSETAS